MQKKNTASRNWFIVGFVAAASVGAFANLPSTRDTSSLAPTQDVSEIRTKRQQELSFDQDFKRLSAMQGRYRENLPRSKRPAPRPARAKVSQR